MVISGSILYFKSLLTLILLALVFLNKTYSQADSSFKNTVRINVTNPMIFGEKAIVLGYERTLPKNQTFSINIGRASFPKFISIDTDSIKLDVDKGYDDVGINISADYRFYPVKQNKYKAPRGVYFGPFYSYNYFNRKNYFNVNTQPYVGSLDSEIKISIHTVGFELGYQFVFWNRVSLDMILLGPGIAFYSFKAKVDTELDPNTEGDIYEILNNFLEEKFPGYSTALNGEEFKKTGNTSTTGLGFRYMIMLGFRF